LNNFIIKKIKHPEFSVPKIRDVFLMDITFPSRFDLEKLKETPFQNIIKLLLQSGKSKKICATPSDGLGRSAHYSFKTLW